MYIVAAVLISFHSFLRLSSGESGSLCQRHTADAEHLRSGRRSSLMTVTSPSPWLDLYLEFPFSIHIDLFLSLFHMESVVFFSRK